MWRDVQALEKTCICQSLEKPIQIIVECRNKKEIEKPFIFKVSRILLDNYQPQELAEAITIITIENLLRLLVQFQRKIWLNMLKQELILFQWVP